MDLRNSRHNSYTDVRILHDEPYMPLSARDSYGSQKAPMMMYNQYGDDYLDKALYLENRMRIQKNIISRHKTEAVKTQYKEDKVLSKHNSVNDFQKPQKSYSSLFSKQNNKSNKGQGNYQNGGPNVDDVWVPKDMPMDRNDHDYQIPETLDTARGKARYALVRLNSYEQSNVSQMHMESVNPLVLPPSFASQNIPVTYNAKTGFPNNIVKRHSVDPNNFIGSENREILEKVNNGQENIPDETETYSNKREASYNGRRLVKKNSKITLDDLIVNEKDKKHPLMSRKSKQSLKVPPKETGNEIDKINYEELAQNMNLARTHERHPSRDTNLTVSRKSSTVNSRQSTMSKISRKQNETPLSVHSVPSSTTTASPALKHYRSKKRVNKKSSGKDDEAAQTTDTMVMSDRTKPENEVPVKRRDSRQQIDTMVVSDRTKPESEVPVKKRDSRQQTNSQLNDAAKSDSLPSTKKQQKAVKSNNTVALENSFSKTTDNNVEGNTYGRKNNKISDDRTKQKNSKFNTQKTDRSDVSEVSKAKNKISNTEHVKSKIPKANEQKRKYADKNHVLRKTDSFKMMGNSSEFFGYCSVPLEDEGTTKKPKSILKKSRTDPDRPDTA
ncbi:Hypothetical predicted protein [Mytilus galloprovincialis]|uniref:Uncharacterized protein n=1 Tax=Mytilus galloprovincialis TaxID=29158 RepID=A0A8B6BYH3_MYTGA|nr:Hypothetical predicted protein [Mytilus galloprovincialis]